MYKIISRASQLAQAQVKEILSLLPVINSELSLIESYGDKHKEISLLHNQMTDFFTKELDIALITGTGDFAVHSAKDLPFPLPSELRVIALTQPADTRDALVGPWNLKTLPVGARVGLSSAARKEQFLSVRPDIVIVEIRGNIGERIQYITRGEVDAVVVAVCALQRLGLMDKIGEILPFDTHPLQGRLAVTARYDRPDLKALFYPIDDRKNFGTVILAGFGPGDPGLMSLKTDQALSRAEIIYYDDLLDKEYLNRYTGEKVYVGKRAGQHFRTQDEINLLLYRSALEGKQVVRLKGGDPFIFGRGGEESRFLEERMIKVEIIPGIPAVLGAAASVKLPLTHRNFSDHLSIASGHNKKEDVPPGKERTTSAYYMSAARLSELAKELSYEYSQETPVALVQWATFPYQKTELRSLKNLAQTKLTSPLMVIVGHSAGLVHCYSRVWHTGLFPEYTRLPYDIVHYPLIKIEALDWDASIPWKEYEGVIFTSQTAVQQFIKKCSIPQGKKIACIGKVTAKCLKSYGYQPDIQPEVDDSEHLKAILNEIGVSSWLYPCSELSENVIHEMAEVKRINIYTTLFRSIHPEFDITDFEGVIFTSASTVKSFAQNFPDFPVHLTLFVRGPMTEAELFKFPVRRENIVRL